jgi:hypothetical protein
MVKSYQKKLVAVASRTTKTLHKRSAHPQPNLPLPWRAARSCDRPAL